MRRYALPFMLVIGVSACALDPTAARPPLGGSLVLGPAPAGVAAGGAGDPARSAVALPDLPLTTKFAAANVEGQILATQGARAKELAAAPALERGMVVLAAPGSALGAIGAGQDDRAEKGLGMASPAQRAAQLRAHPSIVAASPVLLARAAGYRLAALPDAVDLRRELGPVRDQGARATGLFFAVAAAADHLYRDDPIMPIKHASPQFMAWLHQVRLVGQAAPTALWTEAGASLELFHLALRAEGHPEKPAVLAEQGYADEADCPYPEAFAAGPAGTPGEVAARYLGEGLHARLAAGERVTTQGVDLKPVAQDLGSLRTVLASGRTVVVSVPVHPADWSPAAPGYQIAELTKEKLTQVGYQALLLVGYEADPAAPGGGWFRVRNSWGERWADAGHARVSFQYLKDFGFSAFAPERYDRPFVATIPLAPSDGKVAASLPVPPAKPSPKAVVTPRPTPRPTPVPAATPTPKPTAKPTSTPRPSTPRPSASPTATPTPEPTATPTPTPEPTATPTPEPTQAPGEHEEDED